MKPSRYLLIATFLTLTITACSDRPSDSELEYVVKQLTIEQPNAAYWGATLEDWEITNDYALTPSKGEGFPRHAYDWAAVTREVQKEPVYPGKPPEQTTITRRYTGTIVAIQMGNKWEYESGKTHFKNIDSVREIIKAKD